MIVFSLVAVFAALCASGCAATANALQHWTAYLIRTGSASTGARAIAVATVTHRWWLLAVVLQGGGFLLHATALSQGQLIVVQPILVCVVLFALPINRLLRGEPITLAEVGWAALLVAGLAGFLVTAVPNATAGPDTVDGANAAVAAGIAVVALAAVVAWAGWPKTSALRRAQLWGAAAGILFAAQAALLKSTVGLLGEGVAAVVGSWQVYVLVIAGLAGIACSQVAFRAAPLAVSLPVVNTVNPLLGVLVGAVVYDENLRHSPAAVAVECLCLLALSTATVILSRRAEV